MMSPEERTKLIALIQEMQSRGLQIPRELLDKTTAQWFPDK